MADPNIDKALAYLGTTLSTLVEASREPVDYKSISSKLPKRSLSGDHLSGGTVHNFSSIGIKDEATSNKILIKDDLVLIENLSTNVFKNNLTVEGDITASNITSTKISVDIIEAKKILGEVEYGKNESIKFSGENIYGQGLFWSTKSGTKQLVLRDSPDRFFFTDSIELGRDKNISINGVPIIDQNSLGNSITKSNLKELGRLRGLIVDGSINIAQHFFYDANSNRLGLGTEQPNSILSVSDNGIEISIGSNDNMTGSIGTYASHPFSINTDNIARIQISAGGNITLGNTKQVPIQVNIHGKMAVKVNTPDPEVDLHVNGAIKFQGHCHRYDNAPPISGSFNIGDITWNTEPKINYYAGWICIRAGNPGVWEPFGKIGNQ